MSVIATRARQLADFVLSYWLPNHRYDYWHCPHKASPRLDRGDYLIDFIPKTEYPGPFDENGIPLLDLSSQHWSGSRSVVYSPIVITQYGLGWYSRYLRDGNRAALATALKVADWLKGWARTAAGQGAPVSLLYTDYGQGEVQSAMAQGLAISLWCRALKETGDREYLGKACEAFNAYPLTIEQGGVLDDLAGIPVLQEWANERVHILNGHLFAFTGILDLQKVVAGDAREPAVRAEYQRHLESSVSLVQKADLGFWSRYSLRPSLVPNIASYFYHDLHIEMLQGLHTLTGEPEFERYANRWRRQQGRALPRALAMFLKLADRAEVEVRRLAGTPIPGTP